MEASSVPKFVRRARRWMTTKPRRTHDRHDCHPGSRSSGTGITVAAMDSDNVTAAELTIVPANEASWADLQAIFGTTGEPGKCYCQHFKTPNRDWGSVGEAGRRARL